MFPFEEPVFSSAELVELSKGKYDLYPAASVACTTFLSFNSLGSKELSLTFTEAFVVLLRHELNVVYGASTHFGFLLSRMVAGLTLHLETLMKKNKDFEAFLTEIDCFLIDFFSDKNSGNLSRDIYMNAMKILFRLAGAKALPGSKYSS